MKFSIKDFFSKCDQTRRKLQIWSHLLKKSLMENFIFVQCRPFITVYVIITVYVMHVGFYFYLDLCKYIIMSRTI